MAKKISGRKVAKPKKKPVKRNYQKEYANDSDARKKKRASNNRARYKVAKSKGKKPTHLNGDVGHKDDNANNNKRSNLKVMNKSKNRSFARTKTAGRKKTKKK
jgi:hypothetical protein